MRPALLAALLLAGCSAPPPDPADVDAPLVPAWGAAEEAVIRPGVQFSELTIGVPTGRGGCTAAFVFYAANGSAYLSTAAHCLGPDPSRLSIAGGAAYGSKAYCSFEANGGPCETERTSGDPNDFGLVLLDPADVARTSPAILGLGGPTGLAPCEELAPGTRVMMYGNSSFKPEAGPLRMVPGEILEREGEFSIFARFTPSAVPADSGSPVVHEDGRAAGIMRALHPDGRNEFVCLAAALAAMEELTPMRATLATVPRG